MPPLSYAQLTEPPSESGAPVPVGCIKAGDLIEIEPDGTINALFSADEFPDGTKAIFVQAAAPVGWTQDNSVVNAAIRIAGTGGPSGGSFDFTAVMANKTWPGTGTLNNVQLDGSIGATTVNVNQIASHSHEILIRNQCCTNNVPQQAGEMARVNLNTSSAGGNQSHTHGWSPGSVTGNFMVMGQAQLSVKYVDVIQATKDPS